MDRSWTRRKFLSRAAGSPASMASAPPGRSVLAYGAGKSALQGRFVTHVSIVRVNQIEVTPDRSSAKTRHQTIARTISAHGGKPLHEAVPTAE